jgi:photosystem II stability/assembly factor-like uncharacterized protein
VKSLLCASFAFALASVLATGARAHESPHGTQLVWEDDAADTKPLIVTNRGLVFADEVDGETRFSLRCSQAYGAATSDRPGVYLEGSGRITIGMYNGVLATTDRACSTQAGTGLPAGESLANLAGVSPARLLVSTLTFKGTSGVFKSDDGGRAFSMSFRNPTDQYYNRLLVAPSDPQRVYAAGQRADRVNQTLIFLSSISRDGGATWEDRVVPTRLVPFAVHPSKPDVVFAYRPTDMLETEYEVLRSEDSGANFTAVIEKVRKPTSLAESDGGVLWVGIGEAGGLFRSGDDGRTFVKAHEGSVQSVTCLTRRGERLWMCANMAPNTNGVWYSDDGGESFEKLLSFEQVTHPVMCDDLEAAVVCSKWWYDFDLELHPPDPDAGVDAGPSTDGDAEVDDGAVDDAQARDASVSVDDDEKPPRKGSPGCQAYAAGDARAPAWGTALMLGGLLVARRRRMLRAARAGLRG